MKKMMRRNSRLGVKKKKNVFKQRKILSSSLIREKEDRMCVYADVSV